MNPRILQTVLRHATALADGSTLEPDAELLRKFARDRDGAAFAELVRRYGRLVWSVCRQLRPTDADAEDAFQATFLVLVRSAGSIRTNALGPWLHTVAHRVACRANRARTRRHRHEAAAAVPDRDSAVPPSAWDSLAAAVHGEVAELPERLRVPFVLCCIEGRGATEAAGLLGWKLGTLSGRLTRAKQELLDRLARRGLAAPAVAAAAFHVGPAIGGAPAAAIAKALDLIRADGAIPSAILELAKGATTVTKTKLLAAALLVAAGLTATVGGYLASAGAQDKAVADEVKRLGDAVAKAVESKPTAKWEYHYAPGLYDENGKPAGIKPSEFEATLEAMEKGGWTFVGQVQMRMASALGGTPEGNKTGVSLPTLVFRRPAEVEKKAVVLYEKRTEPMTRYLPLNEPVARVEDEVAAVQRHIAELKGRKQTAFTGKTYGLTAEQLRGVLEEASTNKFGKDSARIQFTVLGETVLAAGLPEDLVWLTKLMDKAKGADPAKPLTR